MQRAGRVPCQNQVSMKSGLGGRNNEVVAEAIHNAPIVSMKSGLETGATRFVMKATSPLASRLNEVRSWRPEQFRTLSAVMRCMSKSQ